VPEALGKGLKTLSKQFAECYTRHPAQGIDLSVNSGLPSVFYRALGKQFAECLSTLSKNKLSAKNFDRMERRRRFRRVPDGKKHSAKFLKFAECHEENTRQTFSRLLSATNKTLGKVLHGYRVSGIKHSAK